MKNFRLLMVMFMTIGLLASSCSKKDDDNGGNDPTPPVSFKGKANITIDGNNYDELVMDIMESTDTEDGMNDVGCNLKGGFSQGNPQIAGNNFLLAIDNIPEIGETVTFTDNPEDDDTAILIIGSPVDGHTHYMSVSGTMTRTSKDNYTIDAVVTSIPNFDNFTITGTIEVGLHI